MTSAPSAPSVTDAAGVTITDDQLAELASLGTATVYEASGLDCALDPVIRPVWGGATLVGRALPVRTHPADNLPLHHAVAQARPGDVLVVDGREELCGYWGEVLAVAAQQRGIAGLVIDGGVRDTVELEELGFPAFSRGVCVRRTGKFWPGTVGEAITLAGVAVAPGDAVLADADGVLVLPAAAVAATLTASRKRIQDETGYLARIRNGELTLDIYGFRQA